MYIHTEDIHNFKAAEQLLPFVFDLIKPSSVLDVGCGIGTWLKVSKDLGVYDILGLDGSYVNKDLLKIAKENFLEVDLGNGFVLKREFDLIFCLEVIEHIPEENAEALVKSLCNHR